jgi:excisionase family DNA binding protein
MVNPFDSIDARLSNIETLLLEIKHFPSKEENEHHDKLLSVQEAAKLLSLSVPTLYSKVSKKELPVMKRSKRLYFSHNDLLKYVKEGRRKTIGEIEEQELSDLMGKRTRRS